MSTTGRSGTTHWFVAVDLLIFYIFWYQLIYFRDGPDRCSHNTLVSPNAYPICNAPLSRSARHSFVQSQNRAATVVLVCEQNNVVPRALFPGFGGGVGPGDEVVNRSPIQYDLPGGAKVIRIVYTRNIDWTKYLSL